MFGAIEKLCNKIQRLDETRILTDILDTDSIKAQVVDLNRKQLYEQGLQADGSETGQYAPITISHYKPLAAAEGRDGRSDHITLKDTGAFYESMKAESLPDGMIIKADDPNDLQTKEPKMLGLTNESLNEIRPEIKEVFIEEIKKGIYS